MTDRRLTAGLLVLGGALVVAARSSEWLDYYGYDSFKPSSAYGIALIVGAVLVAASGVALIVRPMAGVEGAARLAATAVIGLLLAGVMLLGQSVNTSNTGAWLATLAIAALASALVTSYQWRWSVTAAWCAAVTLASVCVLVTSAEHITSTHPEITVIR